MSWRLQTLRSLLHPSLSQLRQIMQFSTISMPTMLLKYWKKNGIMMLILVWEEVWKTTHGTSHQNLSLWACLTKPWKYLQSLLCVRGLSHFLYQTRPGNNYKVSFASEAYLISCTRQDLVISTKFAMLQRLISFPIPDKTWKYLQSLLCFRGLSHFLYLTRHT